jgi:hypothetical protein
MSHNIMVDKAYYNVAKSLAPVLKENGILIMLDVTTKDNHSGLYYPQLMNIELNKFTKENSDIKTLLPLSCGKFDACEHACFMQQTFYISHSHKSNDESRVCYRVLCKDTLKSRISLPKSEDTCFIIHPIKHEQGDSAAMCKYSIGNNIIDSFNINN